MAQIQVKLILTQLACDLSIFPKYSEWLYIVAISNVVKCDMFPEKWGMIKSGVRKIAEKKWGEPL